MQDKSQTSSKRAFYLGMNPNMNVHQVYTLKGRFVQERWRIAFSRLRLVSHTLRIETGRWARIPVEMRLCDCGFGIQDERHVLFTCPRTNDMRDHYSTIDELFNERDPNKLCHYIYRVLQVYN